LVLRDKEIWEPSKTAQFLELDVLKNTAIGNFYFLIRKNTLRTADASLQGTPVKRRHLPLLLDPLSHAGCGKVFKQNLKVREKKL
jgi:hypothetical protein